MTELFIAIFFASLILTGFYRRYALHKAILDLPNERSSHEQPIPRGGGIVFVGIFYALLIYLWCSQAIATPIFLSLLGGIPVALIGYCDDLYGVKIQWRMLVHCLAATWGILCLPIPHTSILFFAIFFNNLVYQSV